MAGMFTAWLKAAMAEATYGENAVRGYIYAEIPSCEGIWATAPTRRGTSRLLREVLEEWLFIKFRDGDMDFPVLGGVDLNKSMEDMRREGEIMFKEDAEDA